MVRYHGEEAKVTGNAIAASKPPPRQRKSIPPFFDGGKTTYEWGGG